MFELLKISTNTFTIKNASTGQKLFRTSSKSWNPNCSTDTWLTRNKVMSTDHKVMFTKYNPHMIIQKRKLMEE